MLVLQILRRIILPGKNAKSLKISNGDCVILSISERIIEHFQSILTAIVLESLGGDFPIVPNRILRQENFPPIGLSHGVAGLRVYLGHSMVGVRLVLCRCNADKEL